MSDRLTEDPNGIRSPSEFNINYVRIMSSSMSDFVDITKLVLYIEIFESIYSPFLTLNICVADNVSMAALLPFRGEELVEVDIVGPDGETGLRSQAFYVYKLTDKIQVSDKTYGYTMQCITPAAIADMNLKLSQSMSGQPSDIVQNKILKEALGVNKPLVNYQTKYPISYISNYWSPLQNIKYICDRAVSLDGNAPSYVFYETKYKYNFVTLNALVVQPAKAYFVYSTNTHATDIETQLTIIHRLFTDVSFSYIDRLMSGAYGNRTLTVDPLRKSYQYSYYDFVESYAKFNRLNTQNFSTDAAPRRVNSMFRHRTAPSSTVPGMTSEATASWYGPRMTEIASISTSTIQLDVAGRFNLVAGDVIDVLVPRTDVSSGNPEFVDPSISGRYLITGLKHMLDRTRHTLHIQASRDSLPKVG